MHNWKLLQIHCLTSERLPRQFKKLINSNKLNCMTAKHYFSKRLSSSFPYGPGFGAHLSVSAVQNNTWQLVVFKNYFSKEFFWFFSSQILHVSVVQLPSIDPVWYLWGQVWVKKWPATPCMPSRSCLIPTHSESFRGYKQWIKKHQDTGSQGFAL